MFTPGWRPPLALGAPLLTAALFIPALAPVPEAAPDSPDVTFTGRVTDADTGDPISGAQVVIVGTAHGDVTDSAGDYRFAVPRVELAADEVTLRALYIGYVPLSKRVSVRDDEVRVDFALEATAVSLEALTVAGDAAVSRAAVSGALHREYLNFNPYAAAPALPDAPGAHRPRDPDLRPAFNTEAYDRIYENPFLAVGPNPLSTFAIDVDRASYANVRRFIENGRRPPPDAVRIEELINYFPYDYREPEGEHPFSVTTEVAPAPWRPEHLLVRIGLQGRRIDVEDLPPSNLVFLIDVSGSMRPANKLPLLKTAFRMLVEQLRPEDRVAIVVYAGNAGLVLPSTPGDRKPEILRALARLEAGGSTAGGAGIRLAYDIARQNHVEGGSNRVILATDGDFNVGVSSDAEMVRLIEEKREQGTFLTVLGFGTGNLKDSKMEKLADHGNGNYAYIDDLFEARKVFVAEMSGTLFAIAKDVKIQVEFNPARVRAYRLIGYENRLLRAEDFDDDTKDAGELGAGHSVTALYEVIPVGVETDVEIRGMDSLRYSTPRELRPGTGDSPELLFVRLRYKPPDGDESRLLEHAVIDGDRPPSLDFRFASAVAAFGLILRDSEYRGDATLERVVARARRSRGEDPEGYRSDFVQLAELTRNLVLEDAVAVGTGGG